MSNCTNFSPNRVYPCNSHCIEGAACIGIGVVLYAAFPDAVYATTRYLLLGIPVVVGLILLLVGWLYYIEIDEDEISVRYVAFKRTIEINSIRRATVITHYSVSRIPTFFLQLQGKDMNIRIMCKTGAFSQAEAVLDQQDIHIERLKPQIRHGENCEVDKQLCEILTYRLCFVEKYLPAGCAFSMLLSVSTYFADFNTASWMIMANTICLFILFSKFYDAFSTNTDDYGSVDRGPRSIWRILDIRINKILIIEVAITAIVNMAVVAMRVLERVVIQEGELSDLTLLVLFLGVGLPLRRVWEENYLSEAAHTVLLAVLIVYLAAISEIINWTIADYQQISGSIIRNSSNGDPAVMFEYDGEIIEYDLTFRERTKYYDNESVVLDVHNNPYGEVVVHIRE